jgi:hypothetical protein
MWSTRRRAAWDWFVNQGQECLEKMIAFQVANYPLNKVRGHGDAVV